MATNADKKALADGAEQIKAAQKEAEKPKLVPFTEKELKPTRDIKDVMRDRAEMLPGSLGLKLSDATTIGENLQILDHVVQMENHVQFMVGDVLNQGEIKFGSPKYLDALNRTGRASSTLFAYARTARVIPFSKRIPQLPFFHHRELNALEDFPEKLDNAIEQIKEAGDGLNRNDVREIVTKLRPKKVTTGKAKAKKGKKGVKEVELEELTKAEDKLLANVDAALDEAEDALTAAKPLIFNIKKVDNDYKSELSDRLEFFRKFQTEVIKRTGSKR